MKTYAVSWSELEVELVPCWWRKLFRLPLKMVAVRQRRSVSITCSENTVKMWISLVGKCSLQVEEATYPTPYCDASQPGYAWSGSEYVSTSI